MLTLLDILKCHGINLEEMTYKIHLATASSTDPLEEYFNDTFNDWQQQQRQNNFECQKVISLIKLPRNRWLFAGVFSVNGKEQLGSRNIIYDLSLDPNQEDLVGRVVIKHKRKGRAAYIYDKSQGKDFIVSEIRPQQLRVLDFPGYNSIDISNRTLKRIITQRVSTWYGALSNIKGIYLISDTSSGNMYVGSATGANGIWNRWASYAKNGHGGNSELRRLLATNPDHAIFFRYSILEIADSNTTDKEILKRESYWKSILLTRKFGLNDN